MLITDWVFVDIKKLCDVFRGDDGVVFMFFFSMFLQNLFKKKIFLL